LTINHFDIIVIGGGHAGIEAAVAASTMGCNVALATMDSHALGRMSCNPAIGGTAKGHLVREIDALGGVMGQIADKTGIQFRMLNTSKGPAVWSPRSQNDRKLYSEAAVEFVERFTRIHILQDSVIAIIEEDRKITGVQTIHSGFLPAKAVILCAGTFLHGLMHTGLTTTSGGRFGEKQAVGITESLAAMGFQAGRLKTGTPPRLSKASINWDILESQPGDEHPQPFSFRTDRSKFPFLPQLDCHITHTSPEVHKILEKGFADSPLFTGRIKGVGPRYCPSIEDKIVRFSDKGRHQLFLEPEGLDSDQIYVNGFSTSLPAEIQLEALRYVRGLEECEMVRPGYAVEYDYFPPYQIDLTLETKLIQGLYFAGQVNGTSGYEEAAAQGLAAGINAAAKVLGMKEFVLKRNEAYIGVLVDDLTTKSTEEPYRMFTSRAEHRLLLRQDNCDRRLSEYAHYYGLITDNEYAETKKKSFLINLSIEFLNRQKLIPSIINGVLDNKGTNRIEFSETASKILKRPEIKITDILPFINIGENDDLNKAFADLEILHQAETEIKYEGYIKLELDQIKKTEKYEDMRIPYNFDYGTIKTLSSEGKEKLMKTKPRSIGQASRISGVTPSDISILLVYLKR
jgi:tRNA uridine 5-carboxymethylaminomethyl modification enzyme